MRMSFRNLNAEDLRTDRWAEVLVHVEAEFHVVDAIVDMKQYHMAIIFAISLMVICIIHMATIVTIMVRLKCYSVSLDLNMYHIKKPDSQAVWFFYVMLLSS